MPLIKYGDDAATPADAAAELSTSTFLFLRFIITPFIIEMIGCNSIIPNFSTHLEIQPSAGFVSDPAFNQHRRQRSQDSGVANDRLF
jgi:hypothetical protein